MPANDEFSRGGSIVIASASGSLGTVTLPACPGIIHVVTQVKAAAFGNVGAGTGGAFAVSISDGTISINNVAILIPGGVNVLTQDSWTGDKFQGVSGAAVTISFGAASAGYSQFLAVNWYDI